jgi:MFS family permease
MLGYVYGKNGMSPDNIFNLLRPFHQTIFPFLAALTPWQSTGLKAATPVGNLVGQLVFGWLADVLGRKRMCE